MGKVVYYVLAILYVFWFISAILVIVGVIKVRGAISLTPMRWPPAPLDQRTLQ